MDMKRVLVILTIDTDNLPPDFAEILKEEREVVAGWKRDGVLEELYLRPARNGAVLILKDVDEEQAHQLMTKLPFYRLKKSLEIVPIIKDENL